MLGFHGTDEEYRHENRIMRDETDRRLKRLGDIRRLYKPEKEDHEAAMPKPPAVPESLLESEVTPLTFHQREKDRRKILKEQEEFEVDIRELRHADLKTYAERIHSVKQAEARRREFELTAEKRRMERAGLNVKGVKPSGV